MKQRTVVEIHPGENDSLVIWLDEPSHLQQAAWVKRFPYNAQDPVAVSFSNGMGTVDQIGTYLMAALTEHPAVKEALHALLTTPSGAAQPLIIRISPEAETLPWETVFANGAFLALDQRWPVARMSQQDGIGPAERDFQPPLQVMLVLAADDVDATNEWKGIMAALQTAPFPIAVRAFVAQADLRDEIAAINEPYISVQADMVPDGRDLIDLIRDTQPSPNVLHFFCHGAVANSEPYLRIGTALSRICAGRPVTLFASDIPVRALGERLWLVTLNCCRGAQGTQGAASLVFSLMAAGVPAVAGMRLPVSDADANTFSRTFYRTLVRLLAPAAIPGAHVEIDWTQSLYDARMALCESHRKATTWADEAKSITEWTLPVLYLSAKPFMLRGRQVRRRQSKADKPDGAYYYVLSPSTLGKSPVIIDALSPDPMTDDERTAAETELRILRELVQLGLGAPEEVLSAYRARIDKLESHLYGFQ